MLCPSGERSVRVKEVRRRVTPEKRREMIRLAAKGLTEKQIAQEIDLSPAAVHFVVTRLGGVTRPEMWASAGSRLTLEERIDIKLGLEKELSLRAIARKIGREPSTVSREVRCNGGRRKYPPLKAQRLADERARRPKITKLAANPQLCDRVIKDLRSLLSPQQISARLKLDFKDDRDMRISHETIYKSIYIQGRGELRRELARCLRTGRARRRPQGRIENRGRIAGMVMISERPAEVADRAVPGHWEGDLILGSQSKSAIGTLVERKTRYLLLFELPNGYGAEETRKVLTKTVRKLPASLRRTLTWDQGREMAQHLQFKIDTGLEVYFCDPHSPWQRGSNENTNGLLRQYFPKGLDLSKFSAKDLQHAQDGLNQRPRQTLGWMTPAEKFGELVATIP
jgi:IS30 family transposase